MNSQWLCVSVSVSACLGFLDRKAQRKGFRTEGGVAWPSRQKLLEGVFRQVGSFLPTGSHFVRQAGQDGEGTKGLRHTHTHSQATINIEGGKARLATKGGRKRNESVELLKIARRARQLGSNGLDWLRTFPVVHTFIKVPVVFILPLSRRASTLGRQYGQPRLGQLWSGISDPPSSVFSSAS